MKPPVEAPTSRARRPSHVNLQAFERIGELDRTARDERWRLHDLDLDVLADQLPRLLRPATVGGQQDVAREDRRRGAGPRREDAALRKQAVKANAIHLLENGT